MQAARITLERTLTGSGGLSVQDLRCKGPGSTATGGHHSRCCGTPGLGSTGSTDKKRPPERTDPFGGSRKPRR